MSMCRVFSSIVGRGCLLWPVHSLGKTLLAFALLHSVLQGQICLFIPGISWLPTFAFQSPIMKRASFWVLVLKGLIGLHRTIQVQFLQHYWSGHRLGLLWSWTWTVGQSYSDDWRASLRTGEIRSIWMVSTSEIYFRVIVWIQLHSTHIIWHTLYTRFWRILGKQALNVLPTICHRLYFPGGKYHWSSPVAQ